jgi:hypothetical protein
MSKGLEALKQVALLEQNKDKLDLLIKKIG